MDRANGSAEQNLCELNDILVQLQAILKCSICCSTLRDPVTPSCSHAFCKECIEGVFQRRSAIECPVCRKVISRRSARAPSEHIDSITSMFLQVVKNFKGELKETNVIPKDRFILESQAITQMTDSPLRRINLKESIVTMRKKRKIEVLDVGVKKLARIEESDGFTVPAMPLDRVKEEEKPPQKNKRRGATARTLQLTGPMPDTPVAKSRELHVKKEPMGKPPPHPVGTVASSSRVTRSKSRGSSSTPSPTKQVERAKSQPKRISQATANIAEKFGFDCGDYQIKGKTPPKQEVEEPDTTEKAFVNHRIAAPLFLKPISESRQTNTDSVEAFPVQVQCDLMPKNLKAAIRREKNENPSSSDIGAFFAIFPESRGLFKSNLPILLRELGMRPYNDPNTTGRFREGQKTLKFEIAVDEDGTYLSDHDATVAMINSSALFSEAAGPPIEPKIGEDIGCQMEEAEEEDDEVVPDSEACQEVIKESTEKLPNRPCPSCLAIKIRSDAGCQTEVILAASQIRENQPGISAKDAYLDEASEGTVVCDSNRFEENYYDAPREFVIAVAQRESPNDNFVLKQFKGVFNNNVKIQTEISSKTTHLVLMNAHKRDYSRPWPISFAVAVCRRVEILNRSWIHDSLFSKSLLNTAAYKIAGQDYKPWFVSPSIPSPQVFRDFHFYIPRKYFSDEQAESRDALVRLAILAGGEVFNRVADLQTALTHQQQSPKNRFAQYMNRSRAEKSTVIIFSPRCQNQDAAYRLRMDFGIEVLNANFILDSVCQGSPQEVDRYLVDKRPS